MTGRCKLTEGENIMDFYRGKKLVWNGDSISYGAGLTDRTKALPYLVANALGMNVVNYAISGGTLAKQESAYEACFLNLGEWQAAVEQGLLDNSKRYMVRDNFFAPRPYRLYSFVDGQWVPGGTTISDVARTPLVDRIGEMDKEADVVAIMIGTNDFYYNWTAFGKMADGHYSRDENHSILNPLTSFYGALHTMMRYLLETYKNKDIVLITPIKRLQPKGIGRGTWGCFYPEDKNGLGLSLNDYRKAIIEVAEYYSVPCIDLYALSGLNPHIDSSLFADKDTKLVHPNEAGHERMASVVTAFLKSYRC